MELKELLIKVIASWQVLAATGAIIVYVFLVQYVSRLYRPRKPKSIPMPKPGKTKEDGDSGPETGVDDDLGLEEKDAQ
jgi:hypothetical protein